MPRDRADALSALLEESGALSLRVDALLLAAQAFSEYQGQFNNNAWTVVEESLGVPMTATVTVPETGRWYIEVRARTAAREPNGSQMAARLIQTLSGIPAVVDYGALNGNENETTSMSLTYVENSPTLGGTYSYTIEWTGSGGGNHFYNFQGYTIGPTGDQVSGATSQITAIVRPARYAVD